MESNGIQVKQVDFAAIPPVSFQVESRIAMGGGPVPGVMVLLKRKSILSDSIR